MKIALIDPFYETSHERWAIGLKKHSCHQIDIYKGSPHHWKWKMAGGAVALASEVNESGIQYDAFLVTDMLNLPLFKSLLDANVAHARIILYFHENQITYPWSANDPDIAKKRDHHYGWINYTSALIADQIYFNSKYHLESFFAALPDFLKAFPERQPNWKIESLRAKSNVLHLGLDLPKYGKSSADKPVFLWNHRWEYDKDPESFFKILFQLKKEGYTFEVIVLGKSYQKSPPIFEQAHSRLKDEIIHFGFVEDPLQYENLMSQANIALVTSQQDFFGISTVEAIAAGCYPVLPNRLAFPEHVSRDLSAVVLYNTTQEALAIVKRVIDQKEYCSTEQFAEYVKKYEWAAIVAIDLGIG